MSSQQNTSQLEQILTAGRPHQVHHPAAHQYNQSPYMPGVPADHPHHHLPQYNQQSAGGYMNQMGAGSHPSLGPPPQYPANRPQPTAAGYSQMAGPRPGGMGDMAAMQAMQGGPGGPAGGNTGGNYMYNSGKS